jgi:hypothetical protein
MAERPAYLVDEVLPISGRARLRVVLTVAS